MKVIYEEKKYSVTGRTISIIFDIVNSLDKQKDKYKIPYLLGALQNSVKLEEFEEYINFEK